MSDPQTLYVPKKTCPIFELYEASVFCERLLVKKQKKKQLNLYRCSIIRKWGRSSHTSWRINKRAIEKITLMDSPFIGAPNMDTVKLRRVKIVGTFMILMMCHLCWGRGNDVINEYQWKWWWWWGGWRLPPSEFPLTLLVKTITQMAFSCRPIT